LVYFMAIWDLYRNFGKLNGHYAFLRPCWCTFSHFGLLYQEKSGNPDQVENGAKVFFFLSQMSPLRWFSNYFRTDCKFLRTANWNFSNALEMTGKFVMSRYY
jgi:hypothetical protein